MKDRFTLTASLASLCVLSFTLSGCMQFAHLYPIQGPLSQQTPPPIYSAKMTGVINSGGITAKLANGEQYSGQWQAESANALAKQSNAGVKPPFDLSPEWDTVYGQGFYTAHVLGAHLFVRTTLTGKQGGALHAEMISQPVESANPKDVAPPRIEGVAKDDKGNVYKMAF
jgi:hypothetical protein